MWTQAERARMHRAALEHALADKRRRLENCRFYKAATAPGAEHESENSHRAWCADERALLADIEGLEQELAKL